MYHIISPKQGLEFSSSCQRELTAHWRIGRGNVTAPGPGRRHPAQPSLLAPCGSHPHLFLSLPPLSSDALNLQFSVPHPQDPSSGPVRQSRPLLPAQKPYMASRVPDYSPRRGSSHGPFQPASPVWCRGEGGRVQGGPPG